MERKNSQEGITLVALVITIIVLIILAGVTIGTLVGDNGIIIKAQEGKQNMANAAEEEKASLQNIENVINEIENGGIKEPEEPTDSTIESILKEGDYVWYTDANDTKQKCIVLYGPENENYGSYGIQMVTANIVKRDLPLGVDDDFNASRDSYNSAIATLNTEAENYRKKDDGIAEIARCVGSMPDNPSSEAGYNSSDSTFKDGDTNYKADWNQMQSIVINGRGIYYISSSYWLASRAVGIGTGSSNFDVRCILPSGQLDYSELCAVNTFGIYAYRHSNNLRIVIHLKPGIEVTEGNGSEENPYTLAP